MSIITELFEKPQYGIDFRTKSAILLGELNELTRFHSDNSTVYGKIISKLYKDTRDWQRLESLPYLPVRLFKDFDLKSIPDSEILKTLTSSGTTSQQVSRIAIDKETSLLQTKALASIVTSFIGSKRLPMLIIDSDKTVGRNTSMSARGAGLTGLSNFGRNHTYILDEDMNLKVDVLMEFVEKYHDSEVLLFGFTFLVWKNFYQELKKMDLKISFPKGILIHSGGWKKLQEESVTNQIFKDSVREQAGIGRVHNFYGMVEQVGSIFMECENGYFHTPNFSDVIIRDYRDWQPLEQGRSGILQVLSVLPRSYPGHSLLTEDLGTIHGIDDCPCGRKGTYFSVQGRVPKAEIRGCSDIYAFSE